MTKRIIPDPTQAKDVALYFIDVTAGNYDPDKIARTIKQVKVLMERGYTKEEIIAVIDYIIDRKAGIYSFGYILSAIEDVMAKLREMEAEIRAKLEVERVRRELTSTIEGQRAEVSVDDESAKRNRDKAERIKLQSRFGAKYDFDMFEGK